MAEMIHVLPEKIRLRRARDKYLRKVRTGHICGRHRDGCPKIHRYSVPVERIAVDIMLPKMKPGVVMCDGDELNLGNKPPITGAGQPDGLVYKFLFTHRGAVHEYGEDQARVVRDGWLVPRAERAEWNPRWPWWGQG